MRGRPKTPRSVRRFRSRFEGEMRDQGVRQGGARRASIVGTHRYVLTREGDDGVAESTIRATRKAFQGPKLAVGVPWHPVSG